MYAMKWSYISHVVGVVSGYMENPGKAMKPMLQYFRGTNITYNAWSDLVRGYFDLVLSIFLEKRRYTSSYVLHEYKDLLGKFRKV